METKKHVPQLLIGLAFLAVYLIWGSTYLAIRVAIDTMPPLTMAAARFLLAGGVLYIALRFMGASRPEPRHWLSAGVIGTLLLAIGNGGIVLAERHLATGMVSLLVAMVPVYIAILEHLGKALPSKKVIAGLMLGTAGVGVLVAPGNALGSGMSWLGVGMVMASSLAWSWGSLYSRSACLPKSMLLSAAMQMISGGMVLGVVAMFLREHEQLSLANISMDSMLAFAYLIVFGSIVGFSAYAFLMKHVSPSKVSTYAYVNPVVAVFLGWAYAGEMVTTHTFVAGAVILAAVWLMTSTKLSSTAVSVRQSDTQ